MFFLFILCAFSYCFPYFYGVFGIAKAAAGLLTVDTRVGSLMDFVVVLYCYVWSDQREGK